ncbi:MAG: hypothetical protein ACREJB_18240 [Planctomycetaceae bacterium]
MSRRFDARILTAAVALCVTPALFAQEARQTSPREQVNRRFEETTPALGEPLPDVTLYDAAGKPFRLGSLKGSHTVLVFGCLT